MRNASLLFAMFSANVIANLFFALRWNLTLGPLCLVVVVVVDIVVIVVVVVIAVVVVAADGGGDGGGGYRILLKTRSGGRGCGRRRGSCGQKLKITGTVPLWRKSSVTR